MMTSQKIAPRYLFWVIVGIVVLLCWWVGRQVTNGVWNSGIAFSLEVPLPLIYLVNLLFIAVIAVWSTRTPLNYYAQAGAALVVGGGLANLIDRITNSGRVWDYIPFGPNGHFNLADVAVSLGLLLLFYFWLRKDDSKT